MHWVSGMPPSPAQDPAWSWWRSAAGGPGWPTCRPAVAAEPRRRRLCSAAPGGEQAQRRDGDHHGDRPGPPGERAGHGVRAHARPLSRGGGTCLGSDGQACRVVGPFRGRSGPRAPFRRLSRGGSRILLCTRLRAGTSGRPAPTPPKSRGRRQSRRCRIDRTEGHRLCGPWARIAARRPSRRSARRENDGPGQRRCPTGSPLGSISARPRRPPVAIVVMPAPRSGSICSTAGGPFLLSPDEGRARERSSVMDSPPGQAGPGPLPCPSASPCG